MPTLRDFMSDQAAKLPDGPAKAGVSRAIEAHRNFETEAAKIAGNSDLSAEGKRKAVYAFATKNAHEVVRINKFAERANTRLAVGRIEVWFARCRP